LVDVLETVWAKVDATEIPSDHDEDVVNVLGYDKLVNPVTR